MLSRVAKGCFGLFIVAGLGVLGLALWGSKQIDAYAQMTPAQRAEADHRSALAEAENRRERLKGTGCEKLDPLACYDLRQQRKNQEAAAKEWENSDMKKAYDDAGVR